MPPIAACKLLIRQGVNFIFDFCEQLAKFGEKAGFSLRATDVRIGLGNTLLIPRLLPNCGRQRLARGSVKNGHFLNFARASLVNQHFAPDTTGDEIAQRRTQFRDRVFRRSSLFQ